MVTSSQPQIVPPAPFIFVRLLRHENNGAHNRVMLARSDEQGLVVLKTPHHAADYENFRREVAIQRELGPHPRIAEVLDLVEANDENGQSRPWAVQRYYDGGSMKGLLAASPENRGEEHLRRSIELLADVAEGIEWMHRQRVMHRDLKLDNFFIDSEGRGVVGDFFTARTAEGPPRTDTVEFVRTRLTEAPDVLAGDKHTLEDDIYQFGIAAYHLITGRRPFTDDTEDKRLGKQRTHDFTHLTETGELLFTVPPTLNDIIVRMLYVDRGHRPEADEVLDVLVRLAPARGRATHDGGERLDKLRGVLVKAIHRDLESLFEQPDCPLRLAALRDSKVYATILLRPLATDTLYCVYFAAYQFGRLWAKDDWITNRRLQRTAIALDRCASGLPIRWHEQHEEGGDAERLRDAFGRLFGSQSAEERVGEDSTRLRSIAFTDVHAMRWGDNPDHALFRDCYATDRDGRRRTSAARALAARASTWPRGVGFRLRRESDGQPVDMSQDIQTNVIVPIYDLKLDPMHHAKGKDVLAVLNIEWEHKLELSRVQAICRWLEDRIHDRRLFGFSSVMAEVLRHLIEDADSSSTTRLICGPRSQLG